MLAWPDPGRIGTRYTELDGQWWQQSTQEVYPTDNSAKAATVSIQRNQISGLIADNEQAETVSIDIHGNPTVSRTTIDRGAKTQTRIIDYPDSDIDAETISVNGRVMESQSKTGLITAFAYDNLGRRTGTTDPRTGTAVTHYDAAGRVDYVQDAAGNHTSFGYDNSTGRKILETNALGQTTRFAYNDRGQVTRTWGDVPYPVQYQYDDSGRMINMTTYRTDEGFEGETFPASATGDTTQWHYDQATGLLSAKQYADGSQVTYTYTTGGKLATRTWAREDGNGEPLTTTYSYDPATAELLLIDYSDATADISFAYDRLGRQTQINDAAGTRTFIYNTNLQLESETISGLYDAVLTRAYDEETVAGRSAGVNLNGAYSITYAYDTVGRFNNLAWNANGQIGTATYTRMPDSELLHTLSYNNGQTTTYAYEPDRDLKTQVQNSYGGQVISQYDYTYDAVGRRSAAANSGSAFAQAAFSAYSYNDRSELIAADRYLGTDVADTTNPVEDEQRGYLYDPIGNRTWAEKAGVQTAYTANALNQYTDVTGQDSYTPTYDLDGNLQNAPDGMRYTYNAENRLIAVQPETPTSGDTRVEFTYDFMGRRVQKSVSAWQTDHWEPVKDHLYLYDGWNMVKETTIASGQAGVDKHYVWGLDLSQSLQGAGGVGGLLATVDGSLTYHYGFDANGNVGQVVDASTDLVVAHYEYDPYGNEVLAAGPMAEGNSYRFSTKYFDQETSLYYYGYRYYVPEFGRWISRDPIEEEDLPNLNLFVANDPLNGIDVLGQKSLVDYLEERMLYFYNNNNNQVGTKFPLKCGLEETNCIIYCSSVLAYAYQKVGKPEIAKKIVRLRAKGTELAKYLQSLGWKGIYWNPDVKRPFDNDSEHTSSYYDMVKKKGAYYGIKISASVINYRPTQIFKEKEWWKIFGKGDLDTEKMTKRDTAGLNKLKQVRFGFGVARGGYHTFLYSFGSVYEVHWAGIGILGNLYGKSPFEEYAWLSGAIVVPPGNEVY